MRRRLFSTLALAVFGAAAALSARADDPANKKLYMLKMEQDRIHRVTIGHEPYIENYFYLPFKLTNEDQEDHPFFLEVFCTSKKGVEYRNLDNPIVKEKIRKKLGVREDGVLWDAADLTTRHENPTEPQPAPFPLGQPKRIELPVIKAGETVQCVAIFRGPDPEADKLEITFRGLTNDVLMQKTEKGNERKLTERILVLSYERPGDEYYRSEDAITFLGREWKTVERVVKTDLE